MYASPNNAMTHQQERQYVGYSETSVLVLHRDWRHKALLVVSGIVALIRAKLYEEIPFSMARRRFFKPERSASSKADATPNNSPVPSIRSRTNRSNRQEDFSSYVVQALFGRYKNVLGWTPNPVSTLLLLLFTRIAGALSNGIADCDETYNYWEPLHLLLYGSGLQTWEYSPEFAIRSFAFLYPFSVIARLGRVAASILPFQMSWNEKLVSFYSVRMFQAAACAFAEFCFYDSVVYRFGKPVARFYLWFSLSSPGMFRAASELLPSTFCMILFTFAASRWYIGQFEISITFVGIAAVLGWPFSALLGLPIAVHVCYRRGLRTLAIHAGKCAFCTLLFMVPIDSLHFGRVVIAPLNIIRYNVFPPDGAGPGLFGVASWTFYFGNLILNCNIAFLLMLSAPILCFIDAFCCPLWPDTRKVGQLRMIRVIFLSPCLLWLAVFFFQPHKEERFLAPVYPLILLIGAVTLNDWLSFIGTFTDRKMPQWRKRRLPLAMMIHFGTLVLLSASAVLGVGRIAMQMHTASVPLQVFKKFSKFEDNVDRHHRFTKRASTNDDSEIAICVGTEWFRFPSHFFLPSRRYRLKFLRSDFQGLLPKYFDESRWGTRSIPTGMNMFNKADPEQFVDNPNSICHFFVGFDLSHRENDSSASKPLSPGIGTESHMTPNDHGYSVPFVDLERSRPGLRAFWFPGIRDAYVYGRFYIVGKSTSAD